MTDENKIADIISRIKQKDNENKIDEAIEKIWAILDEFSYIESLGLLAYIRAKIERDVLNTIDAL